MSSKNQDQEMSALREEVARLKEELKKERQKNEQLEKAANHDGLTGIPNRRGFDLAIGKSQQDGHTSFSVAVVDLDFFKRINDEHGHDVGDEALKLFAEVARSSIRTTDTVGRFGGEEFVILLPGANPEEGAKVLGKIAKKLSENTIKTQNGPISFTFSSGVVGGDMNEGFETAIKKADTLLYAAKNAGRNLILAEGTEDADSALRSMAVVGVAVKAGPQCRGFMGSCQKMSIQKGVGERLANKRDKTPYHSEKKLKTK